MKAAFGFKAHSGWAALVLVGVDAGRYAVLDRQRMELVDAKDASWAKQPYHTAEQLEAGKASDLVERGIEAARKVAVRELRLALERAAESHEVVACAVLVPAPMPQWSTAEILAVHFRMHKAEGVLFPDVLPARCRGMRSESSADSREAAHRIGRGRARRCCESHANSGDPR